MARGGWQRQAGAGGKGDKGTYGGEVGIYQLFHQLCLIGMGSRRFLFLEWSMDVVHFLLRQSSIQ